MAQWFFTSVEGQVKAGLGVPRFAKHVTSQKPGPAMAETSPDTFDFIMHGSI